MERYAGSDIIVLLLDKYSSDSQKLYESIHKTKLNLLTIVVEEDYFLPKNILSLYDLLLGNSRNRESNPKFYNEITLPENWTVHADKGKYGKMIYKHEEKGRIHYVESQEKYFVKAVDWYDRKGITRTRDHYDRYGGICARTVYDNTGRKLIKSWFSAEGCEIIVENYVTGDIIFNDEGTEKIFHSKIDLFHYAFVRAGLEESPILYNSLSIPFWISNRLNDSAKRDILFWQEPVGDEIPGNMQMILRGRAGRTGKILVQRKDSYDRLLQLGARSNIVKRLGFIYSFRKENGYGRDALICTNSDQIEHCEMLVRALPKMRFHIAAVTLMSERLMKLMQYNNVSLYPAAKEDILEKLFERCDYYFDINYWEEIVSAVYKAFLFNHLIFAFEETVHNKIYVADENVYPVKDFERMVHEIKRIMKDKNLMRQNIEKQHQNAMTESKENYEGG